MTEETVNDKEEKERSEGVGRQEGYHSSLLLLLQFFLMPQLITYLQLI